MRAHLVDEEGVKVVVLTPRGVPQLIPSPRRERLRECGGQDVERVIRGRLLRWGAIRSRVQSRGRCCRVQAGDEEERRSLERELCRIALHTPSSRLSASRVVVSCARRCWRRGIDQ